MHMCVRVCTRMCCSRTSDTGTLTHKSFLSGRGSPSKAPGSFAAMEVEETQTCFPN